MKLLKVFTAALLLFGLLQTMPVQSAMNSPAAITAVLGIAHGAHIRPDVNYGTQINNFNAAVGKNLAIVMYFMDWAGDGTPGGTVLDSWLLYQIRTQMPSQNYPVIMLSWQPMNGRATDGCNQNYSGGIPVPNVTQGLCDSYIRMFAAELSARPERFLLRFAHEMNIEEVPWYPGKFGLDASGYVAMWKHVHDVVAAEQTRLGKHNIEWVWSINYASNPVNSWNLIQNYYPGDAYVDWIGLSGYNWYNSPGHNIPWKSFTDLYDAVLKDLSCRYAKPQLLTEIGSAGGTVAQKNGWIQDAYTRAMEYPFMRGFIWFNDFASANTSQADFRVANIPNVANLDPSILTTYKNAVANPIYTTSLPSVAAATPFTTYCGNGTPEYSLDKQSSMVFRGMGDTFTLTGFNYSNAQQITFTLPNGITASADPGSLPPPWGTAVINFSTNSGLTPGTYSVNIKVGGISLPAQINVVKNRILIPQIKK